MLATLRRAVWIATTPIAFTILFSNAVQASVPQDAKPAAAAPAEHEGAEGEGELDDAPIKNFADCSWYKEHTSDGDKMPPPFSLALLNFGVLVFLVGKYGAPGFKKMIHDRHATIATQLAESTRLHEEAKAKLDEYTRKISGLSKEIDQIVTTIRGEAETEKQRILAEAQERAARMKRDAEQQIKVEIQRVRITLEREAVQAAMAVAEKILREKTTDADQRTLADKFVKSVQEQRS